MREPDSPAGRGHEVQVPDIDAILTEAAASHCLRTVPQAHLVRDTVDAVRALAETLRRRTDRLLAGRRVSQEAAENAVE